MSTFKLRPLDLETDVEALAELRNEIFPEPITAPEYRAILDKVSPQAILHRVVAVDESDEVAGLGVINRGPWDADGQWYSVVRVSKAHWGRGIGSALLANLEAFAQERGGTVLNDEVRDRDDYSLTWARKKGFTVDRHLFESTLDLATFDESRFAGAIERAEAGGIRFGTLAELGAEEWAPRTYALVSRTVFDIPGVTMKEFVPYEEWTRWALDADVLPPDCFFVAIDGDRVVGSTNLQHMKTTGAMYTDLTSVDREYRGRGLALALKLLSVQAARRYGAPYMRTNNDSTNAPMLAVNRKMGYVACPGLYRMQKQMG